MILPPASPSPEFPENDRFHLLIDGNFLRGGNLEIFIDGQFIEVIRLRSMQFTLLAVLAIALKDSSLRTPAAAFLTTIDLVLEVETRAGEPEVVNNNVYTSVHRIRQRLAFFALRVGMFSDKRKATEWSRSILQHGTSDIGYRIGLTPGQVTLIIDGKTY